MITILDFWAEWCGPCRAMNPVIAEIEKDNADNISVEKINVDLNPAASVQYGITGVPTFVFLKDGVEVDRIVGSRTKKDFQNRINSLLTTA